MNVVQIINAADPAEVARLYAFHWTDDEWADAATFRRFKSMLNAAIGISGTMRAVVGPIASDFGEESEITRYEVDGDDGSGTHWSLGFTSWAVTLTPHLTPKFLVLTRRSGTFGRGATQ